MTKQDINDYLYWCADRYLSYRPRTKFELQRYIKRKLHKKDILDPDEQDEYVANTMQKLEEEGRVDDEKFLKMYVADRQYFKPRGKRRLVLELKQKGVADSLIEEYFTKNTIDEVPLIVQIIQKKLFFNSDLDKEIQVKITNHLLRKGFTYDHIKLAFEDFVKKK